MAKRIILGALLILVVLGAAAIAIFDNIGGRIIDEALENALQEQKIDIQDGTATNNSNQEQAPNSQVDTTTEIVSANPSETPKPQITIEKIKEIKKSVTVIDKATITKKVLDNLTSSDVSELQTLAAGGLTAEEKRRAKEIAYACFTPAEIEELKEMYEKYLKEE